MIRQIVALAGIVAGYVISLKLYIRVANLMPKGMEPGTARMISFVLIFVVCVILAYILGVFADKSFKIAGLSWANRMAGGLLGFLKGFILIVVMVALLIAFLPADNNLLNRSVTLPYVISGTKIISSIIPEEVRSKYKDKVEYIKNNWIQREILKKRIERENKHG